MEYKQKRDWVSQLLLVLCILAVVLFGANVVAGLVRAWDAAPESTGTLPDGLSLVFELGPVDYGVYYFEHYGNDCYILYSSHGNQLSCIPGLNR